MKFSFATKKHFRKNKLFSIFTLLLFFPVLCPAGDVPIERDFLRLPGKRWLWLEKTGVHQTRIILGKGIKSAKNAIWSIDRETDGDKHSWAYAFFVKIKNNQLLVHDQSGNPEVAVSTYDMGTGMIRWVTLFKVKSDRLEVMDEIDGFNVAADENLFKTN
jgi:hypothetical protein